MLLEELTEFPDRLNTTLYFYNKDSFLVKKERQSQSLDGVREKGAMSFSSHYQYDVHGNLMKSSEEESLGLISVTSYRYKRICRT